METFICFDDEETAWLRLRFRVYATLLAISAAFLGVTFFVYIFLVKPLNLHGKTLVCHVVSLFVAYSSLSAVQFATDVRITYCKCIGKLKFRLTLMNHKISSTFFHQLTSSSLASCQVLEQETFNYDLKKLSTTPCHVGNKFSLQQILLIQLDLFIVLHSFACPRPSNNDFFLSFFSAFSWLNVMCIDIYYTFG